MIIAKVAKITDKYRLVINKGLHDGIKKGMKFYVYEEGDDIIDPDTGSALQKEEFVKAWLKVIHVQERIAILESAETETVFIDSPNMSNVLRAFKTFQLTEKREVMKPLNVEKAFSNEENNIDKIKETERKPIKIGDYVKQDFDECNLSDSD